MKSNYLFIPFLLFGLFFSTAAIQSQTPEIAEAVDFLNKIRANPEAFSQTIGVTLNNIPASAPLKWNDQLAIAAQQKAEDMANRNYFNHVNPEGYGMNYFINETGYTLNAAWLKQKSTNFFESLSAGAKSPVDAIIQLISDGKERVHSKAGHRVHLLGIDDFHKQCYDIAIGWAYNENSTYKYYCCVLIAKHDW
jgi:hypothetical protein